MRKRTIIAIVLSIIMLASAGCAGLGEDGPANGDEPESDSNGDAQDGVDDDDDGGEPDDADESSVDDEGDAPDEDDTSQDDADGPDGDSSSDDEVESTDDTDASSDADDEASDDDTDAGDDDTGAPPENGNGDDDTETPPGNENGDNGESETYTLTLQVVNQDDRPQEADFTVEGDDGERLTGDNFNGPAEFDLEPGEYTVTAYTEAFSDTFRLDGEGMEVIMLDEDMEITFTGDYENEEPGTVETTIQVYDENNEHYEGATVAVADEALGETDEHGVFTFELPDDGPYSYDIGADGYDNPSGAIEAGDHEEVVLVSQEPHEVSTTIFIEDVNSGDRVNAAVDFDDFGGPEVAGGGEHTEDLVEGQKYGIEITDPHYTNKTAEITGGEDWTFQLTPEDTPDEDDQLLLTAAV